MAITQDNCYKLNSKTFNVGIYLRISREDEERDGNNSESILNQKDFLTRYVLEHEWNLIDIYCDDGFTGTNFNRPDFIRMIKDIECKHINMVVTKDLSRLGRDYIETGHYLERYFPSKNVRYLAVNDGIDTFSNTSNNDMGPFRSVMNDMYARDISKKVKSVMDNKRKNGQFIGAFAPYGYLKSPDDKSKLIVDSQAAPVVKRIFEMYLSGYGYSYISNALTSEGIISPVAYKTLYTNYKNPKSRLGIWTAEAIKHMLINPTYAGDITQNKFYKVNYKLKQLKNVPKASWITVKGTHEPIIDHFSFDLVQEMIDVNIRLESSEKKNSHLLSGVLFCGDCGERMTFTKSQRGEMYAICSKYKRFGNLNLCTRHSHLEKDLESYVVDDLRRISEFSIDKEKLLRLAQSNLKKEKVIDTSSEIIKLESKLSEIKKSIKSLYEDKLRGILNEMDFINISKDFNREREQLNSRLASTYEKQKEIQSCGNTDFTHYINELCKFEKLDKSALVRLIERIDVFEDKKIMIHYKFRNPFVV